MSGCASAAGDTGTTAPAVADTDKQIGEAALIQHLISAIDGQEAIDFAFAAIPSAQRSDLTADEFQRYILLLRRGLTDKVVSFEPMQPKALEKVQSELLIKLPQQRQLIAQTRGYWLNFNENNYSLNQFGVYYQVDTKGRAYLDRSWISQILRIGDFARLYFNALDQRDAAALSDLLAPTLPDLDARTAITRSLQYFYRYQVDSATPEFVMLDARIDLMRFSENLSVAIGPKLETIRTMKFTPTPDGAILVDDWLPSKLAAEDTDVFLNDTLLFRMGGDPKSSLVTVSSTVIEKKLGKPLLHDDSNCTLQEDNQSLIRLSYNGIDITVLGECRNHYYWRGQIISATLKDPSFRLGNGLRPGDAASRLYDSYPFISVGTRAATLTSTAGEVELKASVEEGSVKALRLSVG